MVHEPGIARTRPEPLGSFAVTTPDGTPGVLLEHVRDGATVLTEVRGDSAFAWFGSVPGAGPTTEAGSLRLTAVFTPESSGRHLFGGGGSGATTVSVDGAVVARRPAPEPGDVMGQVARAEMTTGAVDLTAEHAGDGRRRDGLGRRPGAGAHGRVSATAAGRRAGAGRGRRPGRRRRGARGRRRAGDLPGEPRPAVVGLAVRAGGADPRGRRGEPAHRRRRERRSAGGRAVGGRRGRGAVRIVAGAGLRRGAGRRPGRRRRARRTDAGDRDPGETRTGRRGASSSTTTWPWTTRRPSPPGTGTCSGRECGRGSRSAPASAGRRGSTAPPGWPRPAGVAHAGWR